MNREAITTTNTRQLTILKFGMSDSKKSEEGGLIKTKGNNWKGAISLPGGVRTRGLKYARAWDAREELHFGEIVVPGLGP